MRFLTECTSLAVSFNFDVICIAFEGTTPPPPLLVIFQMLHFTKEATGQIAHKGTIVPVCNFLVDQLLMHNGVQKNPYLFIEQSSRVSKKLDGACFVKINDFCDLTK